MVEKWREVYKFRAGGSGMTSQLDDLARGKFTHIVDLKDGYPLKDCTVEREKRVLEFILPIFYPKKPNRVTTPLETQSSDRFPGSAL